MNQYARILICAFAALSMTGCYQSSSTQAASPPDTKTIQSVEPIYLNASAVTGGDGELTVVRDSSTWSRWWAAHAASAPMPVVDFSQHMVIAVLAGMRGTSCDGVGIESISSAAGKLRVVLKHHTAAEGTVCAQVLAYSASLVLVPATDLPVEFIEDEPDRVWFRQVAHSSQFSAAAAANYVIRDASTWSDIWTRITDSQQPAPGLPTISFDQGIMAVGVFSGAQPSGCWDISVRAIYRYVAHIRVDYQEMAPAGNALCSAVVNYSGDIVTTRAFDLPVEFRAISSADVVAEP